LEAGVTAAPEPDRGAIAFAEKLLTVLEEGRTTATRAEPSPAGPRLSRRGLISDSVLMPQGELRCFARFRSPSHDYRTYAVACGARAAGAGAGRNGWL
jgi:hypothetical protein